MLEEAEAFGPAYRPDLRKMLDTNFREPLKAKFAELHFYAL
jgi:hypothetical protein